MKVKHICPHCKESYNISVAVESMTMNEIEIAIADILDLPDRKKTVCGELYYSGLTSKKGLIAMYYSIKQLKDRILELEQKIKERGAR